MRGKQKKMIKLFITVSYFFLRSILKHDISEIIPSMKFQKFNEIILKFFEKTAKE